MTIGRPGKPAFSAHHDTNGQSDDGDALRIVGPDSMDFPIRTRCDRQWLYRTIPVHREHRFSPTQSSAPWRLKVDGAPASISPNIRKFAIRGASAARCHVTTGDEVTRNPLFFIGRVGTMNPIANRAIVPSSSHTKSFLLLQNTFHSRRFWIKHCYSTPISCSRFMRPYFASLSLVLRVKQHEECRATHCQTRVYGDASFFGYVSRSRIFWSAHRSEDLNSRQTPPRYVGEQKNSDIHAHLITRRHKGTSSINLPSPAITIATESADHPIYWGHINHLRLSTDAAWKSSGLGCSVAAERRLRPVQTFRGLHIPGRRTYPFPAPISAPHRYGIARPLMRPLRLSRNNRSTCAHAHRRLDSIDLRHPAYRADFIAVAVSRGPVWASRRTLSVQPVLM